MAHNGQEGHLQKRLGLSKLTARHFHPLPATWKAGSKEWREPYFGGCSEYPHHCLKLGKGLTGEGPSHFGTQEVEYFRQEGGTNF